MRKYKQVPTTRNIVTSLTCDVCLREYDDPTEMQEFLLIEKACGYGSVFGDNVMFEFDICQHCFHNFFAELVHPVEDFADWGNFSIDT